MQPRDNNLYEKTKKDIYKKIPKHSAYRSGILVKTYKKNFYKKYGKSKSPYLGKKSKKTGIARWFKEKWRNQRNEIGYKYKNDIYRPTIKINSKTPKTFKELDPKRIKIARTKKYKYGRVNKF